MSSNGKGLSSPLGKKIMGYAYGIGASIVIIGALFKILHLEGAALMLTLGMGTEALLFFLGSFEPPHQEATRWDWSKIYPDLVPEKSPAELLKERKANKKGKTLSNDDSAPQRQPVTQIKAAHQAIATPSPMSALDEGEMEQWNKNIKNILSSVDGLSKLSETGKISEDYIKKISNAGEAVEQLSKAQEASAHAITESTGQLTENYKNSSEKFGNTISTAAEKFGTTMATTAEVVKKDIEGASHKASETLKGSTEHLVENYKTSSENFDLTLSAAAKNFGSTIETSAEVVKNEMEKASQEASGILKGSTQSMADSYAETANKFGKTFDEAYTESASAINNASATLNESYLQVTEALNKKIKAVEGATSETEKALGSVGKNLSAINTVYELQLTALNEELKIKEAHATLQENVNDQLSLIQKAVSEAVVANSAYKENSEKLTNTIAELNNVYGNMLSSLNS